MNGESSRVNDLSASMISSTGWWRSFVAQRRSTSVKSQPNIRGMRLAGPWKLRRLNRGMGNGACTSSRSGLEKDISAGLQSRKVDIIRGSNGVTEVSDKEQLTRRGNDHCRNASRCFCVIRLIASHKVSSRVKSWHDSSMTVVTASSRWRLETRMRRHLNMETTV